MKTRAQQLVTRHATSPRIEFTSFPVSASDLFHPTTSIPHKKGSVISKELTIIIMLATTTFLPCQDPRVRLSTTSIFDSMDDEEEDAMGSMEEIEDDWSVSTCDATVKASNVVEEPKLGGGDAAAYWLLSIFSNTLRCFDPSIYEKKFEQAKQRQVKSSGLYYKNY